MMDVALPAERAGIRPTRRVLLVLLTGAPELSGYPIGHAAGSHRGVYEALARLERAGWVESEWQPDPPPGQPGRRRFYRLTGYGHHAAYGVLGLTDPAQM